MSASLIFVPFAGMLVLTALVWVWMFHQRIGAMRRLGIDVQSRADLDKLGTPAINSSANFQNLFEVPVVFYACVLALHATGLVDALHVACAFGFLVFRVAHSVIHCTYNHILQRFAVYAIAALFLWVMVVRFAVAIVAAA